MGHVKSGNIGRSQTSGARSYMDADMGYPTTTTVTTTTVTTTTVTTTTT